MSETLERITNILTDKLGVDKNEVNLESKIVDDLGADSLDAVELIMEIEKEFNIAIHDDIAQEAKTIQDLVTIVESQTT